VRVSDGVPAVEARGPWARSIRPGAGRQAPSPDRIHRGGTRARRTS